LRSLNACAAGPVRRGVGRSVGGAIGASLLMAGLVCVLTLAFAASAAQAQTAYVPQGESGNGVLGDVPRDLAVEDATGRVFVADSDKDRIVVFESGQPGAGVLTTFGEGELSSPYGIAIDQGSGDVYVSDAGNNRIARYTSDNGDPPTYTLDAGYTSPASGSGAEEVGNFASPLAIDPTSGDLLVADMGNLRVERFGDDGGFLDSFDGADSDAGAFTSLLDIATGPDGTIYVIANSVVTEGGVFIEGSVVDIFAGDGTFVEALLPGELGNARAIGYDPRLDNVLVVRGGSLFEGPPSITAIHNGQQIGQYSVQASGSLALPVGIAIPSTPNTPLSVLTTREPFFETGSGTVHSVKGVNLEVVVLQPSAITGSSAHLLGTVDPHGDEGTAHFEYRQVGSADWTSTTDQPVSGNGPQPVAEDVSGLLPNREYEVRLTSTVAGFTVTADPINFKALAVLPTALTGAATGATGNTATLRGSVNPNGSVTTFYFEYGETTAYGSRVPLTSAPVGAGHTTAQLSRTISGLTPGTTYHFRIVAENEVGTAEGDDRTFAAGGLPSEGRAYEQVTPVDSGGTFIDMQIGVQALSGPTGLSYASKPPGEGTASAPHFSRRLAFRGVDGWGSPAPIDPPFQIGNQKLLWMSTLALSRDGTHSLAVTNVKLTPDALEGPDAANIYLKDLRTGSYELIGSTLGKEVLKNFIANGDSLKLFLEGSDDFSTVVLCTDAPLLPGVSGSTVFRWTRSGGLEVMSRMPNGTYNSSPVQRFDDKFVAKRYVTPDGSALLFGLEDGRVFMRVGDETVPVAVSELDGEEKEAIPSEMDAHGRYAFFTTWTPMTADTPTEEVVEPSPFLYRYDFQADDLVYIDAISVRLRFNPYRAIHAVSPDGASVAYSGANEKMSIWHQGEKTELLDLHYNSVGFWTVQFSPNSKYLAFTDADTSFGGFGGAEEGDVYLYDVDSGELSCGSCIDGQPTVSAFTPSGEKIVSNRLPRAVDDNGRLFFTSSVALLPQDTNGVEDVYVFKAGQVSLITPGKEPYPAYLMDISDDGRDVYFATDQSLVAQDVNRERDIYDARIGGGFPSQNTLPPAPCSGEGCQGIAPTPPPAGLIGSESAMEAGQKKRSLHRCKKGRVRVKGRCVKRKGKKAGKRAAGSKSTSGRVR
jgi:WD40 repeat protein